MRKAPVTLIALSIVAVASGGFVARACLLAPQRGHISRPSGETLSKKHIKARPIRRKIIEFGWDLPSADFVAANIAEMERRPFDGIVFRPGPAEISHRAFDLRPWSEEDLHLGTLREIQWSRFTDNFLHLYGASYSTMDWFDDGHWRTIQENMHLYRQAIEACQCAGLAFDPEYYGGRNPWAYTPSAYGDRPFQAVQQQVRARGVEFVQALQKPGEKLTLLFFFLLGYVREDIARAGSLKESDYALLPAFVDGILDAAEPGVTIVDGNEHAYYYVDTNQFFDAVSGIRSAAELVSPENRAVYLGQVQAGSALFVDQVLTKNPDEYRRALWDHNVYTALATSDRYVWVYSHEQDWWNGVLIPGSSSGIRLARRRLQELQPLGYDMVAGPGKSAVVELPSVDMQVARARGRTRIEARVTGSEITRVDFYRSAELVASDERAPYRLDLNALPAGPATLIARVFDADGRHGTSAPVRIKLP